MENKTINDEFNSKFDDFERQFASMRDHHFTFDTKTTEEWTYELTEEEKDRFKHLPTPCAVIGFTPKLL